MNIDQPSAIVLAALIAFIPATLQAVHNIQATKDIGALNDKSALAETPADSDKIMTTRHKSATPLAPSLKALMFIAWGQLSMLLPQVMDGTAPLSNWSISFVGQGSVMLLLGFWLLLKD